MRKFLRDLIGSCLIMFKKKNTKKQQQQHFFIRSDPKLEGKLQVGKWIQFL